MENPTMAQIGTITAVKVTEVTEATIGVRHTTVGRLGAKVPEPVDPMRAVLAALDMAERRILRLEERLQGSRYDVAVMRLPE
jgi:hypothetical protein